MQVNDQNYLQVLVRHLEGELSEAERAQAEQYIAANSDAAEEWRLLQRTRLTTDHRITFPNKARLYRKEEPEVGGTVRKLTPYPYLKYLSAIAAAVLLAAAYFLLKPQEAGQGTGTMARTETSPKNELNHPKVEPHFLAKGNNAPAPDKDKKKDAQQKEDKEKKAPRQQTIIIVKGTETTPVLSPLADVSPIPNGKVKAVSVDAQTQRLEATTFPHSMLALMNAKRQVDFTKSSSDDGDAYVNSFTRIYHFLTRSITAHKDEKTQRTVYAFRLETKNVSINKTFKGF